MNDNLIEWLKSRRDGTTMSGAKKMFAEAVRQLEWIPTAERLPDNANNPGAFCSRYQVMTEWGVTEGWYNPYDNGRGGYWYALIWFMTPCFETWNIDFERGDVPKVVGNTRVLAWRPMPEPYKEVTT